MRFLAAALSVFLAFSSALASPQVQPLDMQNFQINHLATGTAGSDAARVDQIPSTPTPVPTSTPISGTGIVAQTAANTFATRTITTGTSSREILISNANGVSGNPLIENSDITTTIIDEGWRSFDSGTVSYSSATAIATSSDLSALIGVGDKITITQLSGTKYFYVTAISSSVITVTGGSTYSVSNQAIARGGWSHAASPSNFPTWLDWSPSYSASSSTFTSVSTGIAKFAMLGKNVFFIIEANGTTGGTPAQLIFSLPVNNAGNQPGIACQAFDGGSTIGGVMVLNDSSHFAVTKYDASSFGMGSSRGFRAAAFYQAG